MHMTARKKAHRRALWKTGNTLANDSEMLARDDL